MINKITFEEHMTAGKNLKVINDKLKAIIPEIVIDCMENNLTQADALAKTREYRFAKQSLAQFRYHMENIFNQDFRNKENL